MLLVSAHLPHSRLKASDINDTLEELNGLFLKHEGCKRTLSMDANTRIAGLDDGRCIGPSAPSATLSRSREPDWFTNFWLKTINSSVHMERGESVDESAHTDFIAASESLKMTDTGMDGHTSFSSDLLLAHNGVPWKGNPSKEEMEQGLEVVLDLRVEQDLVQAVRG